MFLDIFAGYYKKHFYFDLDSIFIFIFITTNYQYSLRQGPTGPSSLAPATRDKMHPFMIIKW